MKITTYFTDTTDEELLLAKEGKRYILVYEDEEVARLRSEVDANWLAENIIYAVDSSEYTIAEMMPLLRDKNRYELSKIDDFDLLVLEVMLEV